MKPGDLVRCIRRRNIGIVIKQNDAHHDYFDIYFGSNNIHSKKYIVTLRKDFLEIVI